METPIRTHVRKVLRHEAAWEAAFSARVREIEAEGHRIINGGQTSPNGWDITDWRSGEVLATGEDGLEGYEAAVNRLDPDERFWHVDNIYEEVEIGEISPTAGVPPTLAEALRDWVSRAPAAEVAEVAGLSVDEVEASRG
jgi:hypothetical protein